MGNALRHEQTVGTPRESLKRALIDVIENLFRHQPQNYQTAMEMIEEPVEDSYDWDLNTIDGSTTFQTFVISSTDISDGVIKKTLVASRNGPYRIRMGDRRLSMELRTSQQVKYLLSYTWDDIESTPIGSVANSSFEAAADALVLVDHVWFDLLSHANGPQKAKLIDSMGRWYARRDIRVIVDGLYDHCCPASVARFERSFNRGWIFQETCLTRIYNDSLNIERAVKLFQMRIGRKVFKLLGSTMDKVVHTVARYSQDTLRKACVKSFGEERTREQVIQYGIQGYQEVNEDGTPNEKGVPLWFVHAMCEFDAPDMETRKMSLASLLAASKREFFVESDRYIALTAVLASFNGLPAAHTAQECQIIVCKLFCKLLREGLDARITVKDVGIGFRNVLGLSVGGRLTIAPTRQSSDGRGEEYSYDISVEGDDVRASYVDGAGTRIYFEMTREELHAEAMRNMEAPDFD